MRAAVIGCRDIEKSLAFYRDRVGLPVLADELLSGPAFRSFWNLNGGACARAVLLGQGEEGVGQVLLFDFQLPEGSAEPVEIRDRSIVRAYGCFNLNFYTADIHRDFEGLKKDGYVLWSDPVQHFFGDDVGDPIEGIFEGPDRVPINLVELATRDPATRVGQMRAYVEKRGYTDAGFTPIVTSSHGVDSSDRAMAWYEQVLTMKPLIDEVLGTPESNRLLNLPEDAKTRVVFMQGNHMFGKVVLSQPAQLRVRVPDRAGQTAEHRLPGPGLRGQRPGRGRRKVQRPESGGREQAAGHSMARCGQRFRDAGAKSRQRGAAGIDGGIRDEHLRHDFGDRGCQRHGGVARTVPRRNGP